MNENDNNTTGIPSPVADLIEQAWVLIANANEGNWEKALPDWKKAAVSWRDQYHILRGMNLIGPPPGETAKPSMIEPTEQLSTVGIQHRELNIEGIAVLDFRGLWYAHLTTGNIGPTVWASLVAEYEPSPLPIDSDGCYTLPNGECVSPGPCIHSQPPMTEPDEFGAMVETDEGRAVRCMRGSPYRPWMVERRPERSFMWSDLKNPRPLPTAAPGCSCDYGKPYLEGTHGGAESCDVHGPARVGLIRERDRYKAALEAMAELHKRLPAPDVQHDPDAIRAKVLAEVETAIASERCIESDASYEFNRGFSFASTAVRRALGGAQ